MDQASTLRKIVNSKAAQMKKRAALAGRGRDQNEAPRVMAVTSGKGGVGKTNIVGNLAIAFARMGQRVLILDADLGLANIDIIFGIHPTYNIGHVLSGEKNLAQIMVPGPEGIRIVPAGSGFVNLTQLTEGEKLSLLSEFEALEDAFDIVLIDTGAGISSNVLYFNLAADECIIIATSEPTSITDAYAMMKVMSTQYNAKCFKLLVNMVNDPNEAKAVFHNLSQAAERFLDSVLIDYIGYIPRDDRVAGAVRNRKTVMELYPQAVASKKIAQLAGEIARMPRRLDTDGNIKFFLNRFLNYRMGA